MSNDFKRTDRVSENIRRKLAEIIQMEFSDPRLTGFITLTAVTISKDLAHAKVYFTVLNDEPQKAALVLNTASGYFRSLLARRIKLRIIPQLHFVYDESVEYGKKLRRLIDEVNPEDDHEP